MANIFDISMLNGWCNFNESLAEKIVYVSNSGNDTTNNGSESSPFISIQKALSVIENGKFSIIKLKRGDTFSFNSIVDLNKSGLSYDKPVMFKSYGSGSRPRMSFGKEMFKISSTIKNIAFLDIDFDPINLGTENIYSKIFNKFMESSSTGFAWMNLLKSPMALCDVFAVSILENAENILFENCNFLQCCIKLNKSKNILFNRCNGFEDFSKNGGTIGSSIQAYGVVGLQINDSFALSPRAISPESDHKNLSFWNKGLLIDETSTNVKVNSSFLGFNKETTIVEAGRVSHSRNVFITDLLSEISIPSNSNGYANLNGSIVIDNRKIEEYIIDSGVQTNSTINLNNLYIDKRFSMDRSSWDNTFSAESLFDFVADGVVVSSSSSSESSSTMASSSSSSAGTVIDPVGPEIRWKNSPTSYEKGSGNKIEFELVGTVAGDYDFLSVCWHNDLGKMVDIPNMGIDYPHIIDGPPSYDGPPYYVLNEKLDLIPDGKVNLQVFFRLRSSGTITTIQKLLLDLNVSSIVSTSSSSSGSSMSSLSSSSSMSSDSSNSSGSSSSSNPSESSGSSNSSSSSVSSRSSESSVSSSSSVSSNSSSSSGSSNSSNSSFSSGSSESPAPLNGDFDGDGELSDKDYFTMLKAVRCNGNVELFNIIYPEYDYLIGDFDGDGSVTEVDLFIFIDKLLTQSNSSVIMKEISIKLNNRFKTIESTTL